MAPPRGPLRLGPGKAGSRPLLAKALLRLGLKLTDKKPVAACVAFEATPSDEFARRRLDKLGTRAQQGAGSALLLHVGDPAGKAAQRKQRGGGLRR